MEYSPAPDAEIVDCLERVRPVVTRLMRRRKCRPQDFADVHQDVAASAVDYMVRHHKLPSEGEIVRIANCRVADHFRAQFKSRTVLVDSGITETVAATENSTPGASAKKRRRMRIQLRKLLNRLRPRARAIIKRSYFRAQSAAELGPAFGMTVDGVRASIYRSLQTMRRPELQIRPSRRKILV